MMDHLIDYEFLWNGTDLGWVLWYLPVVEVYGDVCNWSIFNKVSKRALVIEDDDVALAVINEMRRREVEVITEYPT